MIDQLLGTALEAVTEVASQDVTLDPFPALVQRIDTLTTMQVLLRDLLDQLTFAVSELMPTDEVDLPGQGVVVRTQRTRSVWRDGVERQDLLDAAKSAISRQVATDPATGEVLQPLRAVSQRTFDLVEQVFSLGSDPKQAFRKTLGLDIEDFRSKEPGTVKVEFKKLEVQ